MTDIGGRLADPGICPARPTARLCDLNLLGSHRVVGPFEERVRQALSAVGACLLPLGVALEIDVVVEFA